MADLLKIKQVDGLSASISDGDSVALAAAKTYADNLDTAQSTDIVDGDSVALSSAKDYADTLDHSSSDCIRKR